ncbi:uroporphyrinogen-III C-methyltransferase [Delftia sp. PS-11]|uniref:uroporphyrinogen-III C-methyltransferase n=1 Tax=Delftia sp. PS-11 TaxID=2767222 RepID=UPI00245492FD|nr:uroporphyrinogen-III C-methyltransferase [Delftia sp. PS-11]KAJ8745261.1 uroporphyrinogen-III C-methyltransferase [Delftia sp. PS-11]
MSSQAAQDRPTPQDTPSAAPAADFAAGSAQSASSQGSAQPGAPVLLYATGAVAVAALVACGMLWQRLGNIQEQLARQSAQSGAQSVEARTLARDAQDLARDSAARTSVMEARLAELSLQRTQLDELLQSMSRSRDENLVVDIESSVRLAQQQAELSGSLQPLVATLRNARQRIERTAQPRLAPVLRALDRDLDRLSRMSVTDTAGLLTRIEDLVRQVDDMPVRNAVAQPRASRHQGTQSHAVKSIDGGPTQWSWWQEWAARGWTAVREEAEDLVRVSRIDQPDAILMAPEQAYFLRENLKLKLLNARLALLSRQWDAARADLASSSSAVSKYFEPASRRTQAVQAQLQQIQANLRTAEQPALNETLAALATAAAGR